MRLQKIISTSLLALITAAVPALADTGLARGAAGITTAAADDRYGSLAGEAGWGGTQDFTLAALFAADAAAAGHVATRGFGDGRWFQLAAASNTFTGVLLGPDGDNSAPTYSFANFTDMGWYAAKADRMGLGVGGVLVATWDAMSLNYSGSAVFGTDLTVDGDTTLGDANTDGFSLFAAIVNLLSTIDIEFVCSSDVVWSGLSNFIIESEVQTTGDLDAQAEVFAGGTFHASKGADVASADPLVFPRDGNYFDITGATTINHINKSGWLTGTAFVFQFDASLTVTHNAGAPPINTLPILLQGGVDFVTAAGDTLTFVNDGVTFREISRTVAIAVARTPITVMFGGGATPYFSTTSASFTTAGIFWFPGTSAVGTPTHFIAVGSKDVSPTSWEFQVIDITNATTIVTKTGNTGTTPEIVNSGALSNLPVGGAMFEIQIRRDGGTGGNSVFINSSALVF